jgi:alkaline phosphatase
VEKVNFEMIETKTRLPGKSAMRQWICLFVFLFATAPGCYAQARNVILFLGDAGGIPTLNIASIREYNAPQRLFIQHMPHIALSDTSAADVWVTDSAAGMTAIVTGQKTNDGVLSESSAAIRGKKDGEVLETILEYAEQHGLSTGVLTNMNLTDATPAACYAHSDDRSKSGEIMGQMFKPRFGDGVDVAIGSGRDAVLAAAAKLGLNVESLARKKGYAFYSSIQEISPSDRRVIVLSPTGDFNVEDATSRAIHILSQNKRGYFLMVEWDMHTDNVESGLRHAIEMDNTIRQTAQSVGKDTLIIFTADHSFDIRLLHGYRGKPLRLPTTAPADAKPPEPDIAVGDDHSGEQVLAAALGPGGERLHGFIENTDLFHIMMAAYGWEKGKTSRK